jgi:acyl-CoA thioester hydrolase
MSTNLSGYLENNTHFFPLRVYFSDTDAGGVVYHSRYLDMAEHARTEWLHLLNIDHRNYLKDHGLVFVVRSVKADYLSPAFLDDTLVVKSRMKKAGRFALEISQEVFRDDQVLSTFDFKLGFVSVHTGRPSVMPDEWQEIFASVIVPQSEKI